MSLNREEIAADLVWRYVEHLRQSRGEDANVALSAAELTQLAESLALAGDLSHALAPEAATEARKAAVLRRVEAAVAEAAVVAAPESPAAPSRPWYAALTSGAPVPAWKFRAAFGVAVALAIAFSVAIPVVRSRAATELVVKRVRVPVQAAEIDIQPVEESLVHDLLPRMVRNELPPKQERNLMWHMLVCRGCFDEYVELKHHRALNSDPQAQFASYQR